MVSILAKESNDMQLDRRYSSTEVGVMNTFLPGMSPSFDWNVRAFTSIIGNPGMNWEYLEMSKQFRSEYVPQHDGTYELTVVVRRFARIR